MDKNKFDVDVDPDIVSGIADGDKCVMGSVCIITNGRVLFGDWEIGECSYTLHG